MADAMIDLRDALRDAKPSSYAAEVEIANQKLIASEDKVVDKLGEIASKMARIETVRRHDEEYFMSLDKRIAKDIDVDLSEAIVRMTQATTAYQAAIRGVLFAPYLDCSVLCSLVPSPTGSAWPGLLVAVR